MKKNEKSPHTQIILFRSNFLLFKLNVFNFFLQIIVFSKATLMRSCQSLKASIFFQISSHLRAYLINKQRFSTILKTGSIAILSSSDRRKRRKIQTKYTCTHTQRYKKTEVKREKNKCSKIWPRNMNKIGKFTYKSDVNN